MEPSHLVDGSDRADCFRGPADLAAWLTAHS